MNQRRLSEYGATGDISSDLDRLTEAERRAFVAVRLNGVPAREHARETGRSPGTVGNLLSRADAKLSGGER